MTQSRPAGKARSRCWSVGFAVKFSKSFVTTFFPVGDDIRAVLADWVVYLRTDKSLGLDDALFPATKVAVGENSALEPAGLDRKHWSSAGPIRVILKAARICPVRGRDRRLSPRAAERAE
jgi:hypothetical protein